MAGRSGILARLAVLGLACLSVDPEAAATPSAAGDGLVAFQREVPAGNHTQTDVYTVAPDGSGVQQLTRTPKLNEFGPVWAPSGRRIALWRTAAPVGTGSLWVMAADGTAQRRLTIGIDARDPSWNPAGTRLAYDLASDDLYSLRVKDGKDRRQLTSGPALDFEPAWSPDGTTIAFTRGTSTGDPGDLYLLDVATGHVLRLTSGPAYDHQVAWGPFGHTLVFERDFGDRSSIFTVRRDGTALTRLTRGPYFDVGPTFSPDATRIAFGSDRSSILDHLWMIDSDGSDLHEFLSLDYSNAFPSWRA